MIDIVVNVSDEYSEFAGVMLVSLFENNKETIFNVFLLSSSISKHNYSNIEQMVLSYSNNIQLILVDKNKISLLPIHFSYHNVNVYLRVLASDLLPRNIHKFIYFDCDIIVNGDITELWNFDVSDVALAASKDLPRFIPLYKKNLNLGEKDDYFNSGVMVVNADYWRDNNIANQVINYAINNGEKIIACDQDAMNAVLKGKFKLLSRKWNVYPDVFFEKPDLFSEEIDILEEIRNNPIVIHFLYKKPWINTCRHPFKDLFFLYYKKYLGRDFIPIKEQISFIGKIKKTIKHILYIARIKKAYDTYDRRFLSGFNRYP